MTPLKNLKCRWKNYVFDCNKVTFSNFESSWTIICSGSYVARTNKISLWFSIWKSYFITMEWIIIVLQYLSSYGFSEPTSLIIIIFFDVSSLCTSFSLFLGKWRIPWHTLVNIIWCIVEFINVNAQLKLCVVGKKLAWHNFAGSENLLGLVTPNYVT